MASPLTPVPNGPAISGLEFQKFRADTSSGYSVAVVNPDGTVIGGGSGGGGVQYVDAGSPVTHATGNALIYFDVSNIPREVNVSQGLPTNLTEIGGAAVALGQTGASGSLSVVSNTPPATVVSGQQSVTATAAVLPSHALTNGFVLTVLSTSTLSVFWGPSGVTTSSGTELLPGGSIFIPVSNTNGVYVIASSTGSTVTFGGN